LFLERIESLLEELRGRDHQGLRSGLFRLQREITDIAYRVRKLEAEVKDGGRTCASNSASLNNKLDSARANLSARVEWLNECVATLMTDQEGHKAALESLRGKIQSMVDTCELDRRLKALEEELARAVSLLELPPSDLMSVAFRKRSRKCQLRSERPMS
jgi:hypothetical protein